MFFQPKNPKNELDSLDRALEILQDRYDKKVITLEQFSKECQEIGKKRERYKKKLENRVEKTFH